jgi:hypothetical protein
LKLALSYLSAVIIVTVLLFIYGGAGRDHKEKAMSWTELDPVEVKAKGDGLWTWAYDWIDGPALIMFEADGEWQYSQASKESTADGDLNAMICSRNCLMPDAPVGALLAKIGGSTAGVKDGKVFLVGRKALVQVDQGGPLLLSINDELTGMGDNSGSMKVKIAVKKLPPATQQSADQSSQAKQQAQPAPGTGNAVVTPPPSSASAPKLGSGPSGPPPIGTPVPKTGN